ncbi:hypothetical protein M199_gp068 [Halogranum tailed virus 1]|uniref:Uncharacterized protein n=1 Tax=Halogranum tailed virus 1 TaxID=1273749 RepID=R4TN18_9CAUD|nr:hypothetical protein M199_gp068 [Halogranum tailed virus 1]AGM11598.1 hypothetical protein HGTV1_301 [Halogranum tailed virus 1]
MPTLTQYDWCERCEERMELVPMYAGEGVGNVLVCHKCGF